MATKSIEVRHDHLSKDLSINKEQIKFGISTPFREGDKGELVLLDPDQPLTDAIVKVCGTWGFPEPSLYALKFSDSPFHYVTENMRKEISGKLVVLKYSPHKVTADIMEKIKSPSTIEQGLQELVENSTDPTLVDIFVEHEGLSLLMEIIEKEKLVDKEKGLANALQVLLDILIISNNVNWDKVPSVLFSRVAAYVNTQRGPSHERLALKSALQVLENAISLGDAFHQVEKDVPLSIILIHMQSQDPHVQQNALSLINALFSKAEIPKRKYISSTLSSRKNRENILQYVIKKPGERPAETNHQLYVMQTLFLNLLDERKDTKVDPQDQDALNKIKELCTSVFDSTANIVGGGSSFDSGMIGKKEKPNFTRDYKKLGFQNDINPTLDFETPPGILALDCLYFLAREHPDLYNKLILDCAFRGSGDECPFARSAIALTMHLCDILKVGEPPGNQQEKFYVFFFQHDRPFEELFCVCIELTIKTWKEMRATAEDFDKVFDVVREQIRRGLESSSESLDAFKTALNGLSYNEITKLRAKERNSREEGELQAKPIQELRKKLEPDMLKLIKQNRLNFLINGTRFNKFSAKGNKDKGKFWFCRLSSNAKVFHYGDCVEKATPFPEELPNKVSVVDIKELYIGKDCPHWKICKEAKNIIRKSIDPSHYFSLVTEKDPLTSIDFVAPDENTFDMWTDGVNAILGKSMVSKQADTDLDLLLHMEIKLRLLDIEGIPEIPQEALPIPPPPENFDFRDFINVK